MFMSFGGAMAYLTKYQEVLDNEVTNLTFDMTNITLEVTNIFTEIYYRINLLSTKPLRRLLLYDVKSLLSNI